MTNEANELLTMCRSLMNYTIHTERCEINYTDFCTCGLRELCLKYNTILQAHQTHKPTHHDLSL
jgi:hypothetical protein